MANANITGNGTVILNTPLWAGVGGATVVNNAGSLLDGGDTDWLQSPIGSNAASGTVSLAIIDVTCTTAATATDYDLALATNAISGTELIAVLGHYNTTTAAGRMAEADHTGTLLRLAADANSLGADVYRIVFLYR